MHSLGHKIPCGFPNEYILGLPLVYLIAIAMWSRLAKSNLPLLLASKIPRMEREEVWNFVESLQGKED